MRAMKSIYTARNDYCSSHRSGATRNSLSANGGIFGIINWLEFISFAKIDPSRSWETDAAYVATSSLQPGSSKTIRSQQTREGCFYRS